MASEGSGRAGGGVGFTGLLTILFVALRLTGFIDWPWWVVLSPLWAGAALYVLVFVIALAVIWRSDNS